MSLLNTTCTCLLLSALMGCGTEADSSPAPSASGAATPGGAVAAQGTDSSAAAAEIDVDAIPSQDVADAAAEEAIDESNADEAFDALMQEINEDG